MSFRANPEQQPAPDDSVLGLAARERKALDGSWARVSGDEAFPVVDEAGLSVPHGGRHSRPDAPAGAVMAAPVIKGPLGHAGDGLVGPSCSTCARGTPRARPPTPGSRSPTRRHPASAAARCDSGRWGWALPSPG